MPELSSQWAFHHIFQCRKECFVPSVTVPHSESAGASSSNYYGDYCYYTPSSCGGFYSFWTHYRASWWWFPTSKHSAFECHCRGAFWPFCKFYFPGAKFPFCVTAFRRHGCFGPPTFFKLLKYLRYLFDRRLLLLLYSWWYWCFLFVDILAKFGPLPSDSQFKVTS